MSATRRGLLRLAATGMGASFAANWFSLLAAHSASAADAGTRRKSCILLWMNGGPSHLDTFDLKPDAAERGEIQPIATSVPGIDVSEHFPQFARQMQHAAILRSMSTVEADHDRGRVLMHTGFRQSNGGVRRPSLGAIVSAELGEAGFLLPNFVVCGLGNERLDPSFSGFLGPEHRGLIVPQVTKGLEDLRPAVTTGELDDRLKLWSRLEDAFRSSSRAPAAEAHGANYRSAVALMRSDQAQTFDVSQEPAEVRTRYGASEFGQGCLMARRLVEAGVPFVEVVLGGWDTHQNNFPQVKRLSSEVVDPAMSALIADLADRRLLDSTLVIWMGEFGRTPKVNEQAGRDHYARAWSTVLMGGGVRGGQVIGRTDRDGAAVVERPVSPADFVATVCALLGIDTKRIFDGPGGRTIPLLDGGAQPIGELLPA
jgi:hypothetical protein